MEKGKQKQKLTPKTCLKGKRSPPLRLEEDEERLYKTTKEICGRENIPKEGEELSKKIVLGKEMGRVNNNFLRFTKAVSTNPKEFVGNSEKGNPGEENRGQGEDIQNEGVEEKDLKIPGK